MQSVVSVDRLNVAYYGKTVVQNVSFDVPRKTLMGIAGPNGAGKSTLIKAILGLVPTATVTGKVQIFGQHVNAHRRHIAYVPQRTDIDWDFPITVIETVLIGTYPHLGLLRRPGAKERDWAYACLEEVGMSDYARRQIGELSGGQQQRVFIARALAQKPSILLLDEPFAGIDVASEKVIIRILRELRDDGKTLLVVHHDLKKVREYFDTIMLINREIVTCGPVEHHFNSETVATTYESQFPLLEQLGVTV